MTSVSDRTAQALYEHKQAVDDFTYGLNPWDYLPDNWAEEYREAAKDLEDRNLLMPDLPEPTDPSVPEWESPNNKYQAVSVSNHGTVRIWGDTRSCTPKEARDIAYALLAAANHAERGKK